MKFKVCITETLQRVIEVEAEDKDTAYDKADDMIKNEEIVLDSSDYVSREFEIMD